MAVAAAAASMAPVASSPTAGSPPMIKKAKFQRATVQNCTSFGSKVAVLHLQSELKPHHSFRRRSDFEESTPKTVEAGKLEPVAVSSFKAIPQSFKNRGVGAGHSTSKLKIAQASGTCRTLLTPQTLHGRRGCFLLSSSPS